MTRLSRIWVWIRANPRAIDILLAAVLLLLALDPMFREPAAGERHPNVASAALLVLTIAPLVWRRSQPAAVVVVIGIAAVVYEVFDFPDTAINAIAALCALYAVGAYASRGASVLSAVYTAVVIAVILWANWTTGDELSNAFANYVIFGTAWVAGDNVRHRRASIRAFEERALLAEAGKEEEASRAVTAERTRIARELHDIVAHSVSVMVVQAGAARRLLLREDPDPARAVEALESVETTGRESLNEVRRLLGVLRKVDERSFGRVPQPSIRYVDSVVAQPRDADLDVELVVEGEPKELAAGVDLTAYRIVQEALTNALKHAGPAVDAEVHVCYADHVLEVVVTDDGRGADHDRTSGGHGLVGMQERVSLFGGELHLGNRPGGGYQVRATLPLGAA